MSVYFMDFKFGEVQYYVCIKKLKGEMRFKATLREPRLQVVLFVVIVWPIFFLVGKLVWFVSSLIFTSGRPSVLKATKTFPTAF